MERCGLSTFTCTCFLNLGGSRRSWHYGRVQREDGNLHQAVNPSFVNADCQPEVALGYMDRLGFPGDSRPFPASTERTGGGCIASHNVHSGFLCAWREVMTTT